MSNVTIDALEPRRLMTEVSGVVFTDKIVANGKPDPGEGLSGIVITLDRTTDGVVSTITTGAGGQFARDLLPGTYDVSIAGPGITGTYQIPGFVVSVSDLENVLFQLDEALQPQQPDPTPANKPDLAVSVTPLPGTLVSGKKPVPVTVTVSNKGTAYNGPVTASVYFSKDKVIDPSDRKFGPVTLPKVSIAAGAKKSVTFDASPISSKLPPGTYNILVNLTGIKGDANAKNNTSVAKSTTKVVPATPAAKPNLVPGLPGKLTLSSAKRLSFGLTLKNTGDAKASGLITLDVSAKPLGGGPAIKLGKLGPLTFALAAKNGQASTTEFVDVSALPAGTYRLSVKVVPTLSGATESSTKDNTAISVATFTIK